MTITRLTWPEIKKEYPNQNVCLTNIEWEDYNHGNIRSAEVLHSEQDMSLEDLLYTAVSSDGGVICRDTTDDPMFSMGVLGLLCV